MFPKKKNKHVKSFIFSALWLPKNECDNILPWHTWSIPGDTSRNKDVVITSKWRHFVVITSKWRFNDVIIAPCVQRDVTRDLKHTTKPRYNTVNITRYYDENTLPSEKSHEIHWNPWVVVVPFFLSFGCTCNNDMIRCIADDKVDIMNSRVSVN